MCCVLGSTRGQLGIERDGEGQTGDRIKSLEIEVRGKGKCIKELFERLFSCVFRYHNW